MKGSGASILSPLLTVLGFLLFFITLAAGQSSTSTLTATSTSVSLTPAMASASVASFFSALATVSPEQPGNGATPGDGDPSALGGDSVAGASGSDTESITLSTGAIIAIAVVVGGVVIIGVTMATLWYFAKKRSWEIRASIRRSARRVATALTPRRSTFPKDVRRSRRYSTKGMERIDEVPDTPKPRNNDVEKAHVRLSAFEFTEPEVPKRGWGSRFGFGR